MDSPCPVLLIDDDAAARTSTRRVLEQSGYRVVEAAGGREALEKLRAGVAVHCVITDLKMDEGSGGWLLAQLGYEFPALLPRTLLMSGDAGGTAAAHVAARWRCPMLAKPFHSEELVGALRALAKAA
jgi:DNA-binding NtrC family response regulator